MEREPADLLLPPGMFGVEAPPPLRIHVIERQLLAVTGATTRMANALERILPKLESLKALESMARDMQSMAKDLATLRQLVERTATAERSR